LKLIDELTRALAENQKLPAYGSTAAADQVEDKSNVMKRGFEEEQSAELRLQLDEANLQIAQLRCRLKDSTQDCRAAVSTAWKSSEDVRAMMEEQADRYEQQIEVLSLHKHALTQQVKFLQAELQQLRSQYQQNTSAQSPSLAASIDWTRNPVMLRKCHRYMQPPPSRALFTQNSQW
jgi:hypothetical protein